MHIPSAARTGAVSADESGYSLPLLPILAGDGPTLIHAAVAYQSVPQAPPPNLEGLVVPMRDSHGSVRDWRLAAQTDPSNRLAFARWHESFVTGAVIGDVATARGLMNWARGRVDLSELGILQLAHARVSPRHARRMAWQLRSAAEACEKMQMFGVGVGASAQTGLARGFVCPDGPLMLLAEGGAWVAASQAGLLLHIDDQDLTVVVHGWRSADGNITADTDDGELDLWGSAGGKLLARVAPGLGQAVVRQVPLTKVFAGFFVTLADMALLASLGERQLQVDRPAS